MISNKESFIAMSFISRFINGLGSGSFLMAENALIPIIFPDKIEKVYSIIESGAGLGFILGPLMGAFLFYYFGY